MDRKEAIEVIREYYPSSGKDLNEALETLIPELKESDDEMIRKVLIHFFSKGAEYDSSTNGIKDRNILSWLEKQGSQNLANSEKTGKDELMFKVGDWVVNKHGEPRIFKVISRSWPDAFLQEYKTGQTSPVNVMTLDKQCRLWDITKDAKDGDVLSFNDGHGNDSIELIKSITEKKIEFWFCLTNGNRYEVFDGITPYTNLVSREDATPATKEQRDLLFQKMGEAGYEWDAEKKELRKIEQNPAWSEEDESKRICACKFLDDAKHEINYAVNHKDDIDECITWLKSLKNRVQPKQEWSEEDERIRYAICDTLDRTDERIMEYNSQLTHQRVKDWLKSLKERYAWKPSDEQMRAFCKYLDEDDKHLTTGESILLQHLYINLKKLKG